MTRTVRDVRRDMLLRARHLRQAAYDYIVDHRQTTYWREQRTLREMASWLRDVA